MILGNKFEKAKWRVGVAKDTTVNALDKVGASLTASFLSYADGGSHVDEARSRVAERKTARLASKP